MEEKTLQMKTVLCYSCANVCFHKFVLKKLIASVIINLEDQFCCFKHVKFVEIKKPSRSLELQFLHSASCARILLGNCCLNG